MKANPVCSLLAALFFSAFCPLAGYSEGNRRHWSTMSVPWSARCGEGNTYPGPTAPFGMVQLSPDTDKELWDTASGYEYSDPTIMGFSLTHLSGTGIPDLGDFLFMPQVGTPQFVPGAKDMPHSGLPIALLARRRIGLGRAITGSSCKSPASPSS